MSDINQYIHSPAFNRQLLESLPCGLLVFDQGGNVLDVNCASERLFGSRTEKVGPKLTLGSMLNCLNASENPEKCGTNDYCGHCELRNLALSSITKNEYQESTAQYQIAINGQVKDIMLALTATPYGYRDNKFCLMVLENLSSSLPVKTGDQKADFHGIVGQNEKMLELYDTIKQIRSSGEPVLIQGESGTGKELVASAIHQESMRSKRHFVPVNCGALPEGLLESEIFGHVKGAFTGAAYNKKGRFKIADRGTIFLDEISEMSPAMQAKFLRVIETGSFEPVGSDQTVSVNVRIISATNRQIENEIENGRFRRDLYYRLCVIPILLPPLRARKDDIRLIASHFLENTKPENRRRRIRLSEDALSLLGNYDWPGNVRELHNILKYAIIKCKGNIIKPNHFPHYLFQKNIKGIVRRHRLPKLELSEIANALRKSKGNKKVAAEMLGISRSTLYRYFNRNKTSG